MITAWIVYHDGTKYKMMEATTSATFDSTDPEDWGLPKSYRIIATFQNAQFISAWVEGNEVIRY